jgi:hypothetical protein
MLGDVFYLVMKDFKADVSAVLSASKEFVLDLEGKTHILRDLCVSKLDIQEKDFNSLIKLDDSGVGYQSDANSDGNLRY